MIEVDNHHRVTLDGRTYIAWLDPDGLVGAVEVIIDRYAHLNIRPIWNCRSGRPLGPMAQRVVRAIDLVPLIPGKPPAVCGDAGRRELAR